MSWMWSVYKCSQIVAVPFFTRLVANSSTEFNWNAHRGTAKPGFSRDWLSARILFAKLTSFHPHQCAHRMQLRSFRATADVGNCRATHPTDLAGDLSSAMLGP